MANIKRYDYETIDRPYDSQMNRGDSLGLLDTAIGSMSSSEDESSETDKTVGGSGSGTDAVSSPNQVKPDALDGQSVNNIWIASWIKSQNYAPKARGFLIDGVTGYIECRDLYSNNAVIEGNITATSGRIGHWYINPVTLSSGAVENTSSVVLDPDTSTIRIGSLSGNYINIDGANLRIRSSNYASGVFGAGFTLEPDLLEVGNIAARGMIRTAVFQKDVVSAVGGNLAVLAADVLDRDMNSLD